MQTSHPGFLQTPQTSLPKHIPHPFALQPPHSHTPKQFPSVHPFASHLGQVNSRRQLSALQRGFSQWSQLPAQSSHCCFLQCLQLAKVRQSSRIHPRVPQLSHFFSATWQKQHSSDLHLRHADSLVQLVQPCLLQTRQSTRQ
eukprot:TRINITY_DN1943_c0_g1_i6.p3 TRINITY_DN1943_c0_g1~~TRINITY_DN1943_c0_g1_i6.p3  ORF type:complete len:142 (-),score=9.03 TRINITY_DN1943_c0_g1_i6:152-577(-)